MTDSHPAKPATPRQHWARWRRAIVVFAFAILAIPRTFWRVALIAYFVLAAGFLLMRYVAAPQITEHREDIVAALSRSLGLKIEVVSLKAEWSGFRPELHFAGLKLFDRQGRVALELPHVDASIAWSSLWRGQLELNQLEIQQPELMIRREANGAIFIAGLQVNDAGQSSGSADLILRQHNISIRDARLSWRDEQRGAPLLQLDHVSFRLENDGSSHRFALKASPPAAYAETLDMRGDLRGEHLSKLQDWHGALYVAMDRADLAVWQRWIDYPVTLPRGKGGVRAWLNFEGTQVAGLTADVALRDVQVRFAQDLPMLELDSLSGRVAVNTREGDFSLSAERFQFATHDGLQLAPARFSLRRVAATKGLDAHGEVSGDRLDMHVLAQMAIYVPMPDAWRLWLSASEPRGRVNKLTASWQLSSLTESPASPLSEQKTSITIEQSAPLSADQSGAQSEAISALKRQLTRLPKFKIEAEVAALALRPQGHMPGFEGLSGSIKGSEESGELTLHIKDGGLYLPRAMSTPYMPFDQLDMRASWGHERVLNAGKKGKIGGKNGGTDAKETAQQLRVQLHQLAVSNADLHADLSGNWRGPSTSTESLLGTADLSGQIKRANVSAVWKYMPLVLEGPVTNWLEQGLRSGIVDNGHLRIAGDLSHFPFRNYSSGSNVPHGVTSGIFRIDGHFREAEIEFAPRWPALTGITGELLFEGSRMLIRGDNGRYGAAQVSNVAVEIPDLLAAGAQVLTVTGHASGPTTDFLSYVSGSPLANISGHLTDAMQAQGSGELDLNLLVPLHDSQHTQVKGAYRFAKNNVRLLPALPEFRNSTGKLEFTEHAMSVPELSAEFIGGRLNAKSIAEADGTLRIDFSGNVPAKGLSQLIPSPAWSHLSGETTANASIRIRKHVVELGVQSALVGITSNLPAPFMKNASEALPLAFGWQLLSQETEPGADAAKVSMSEPAKESTQTWRVKIGKRADAQWQDHCDGKACSFVRGGIGIGDVASLPEHGMRMSGRFNKLNIDEWKPIITPTIDASPVRTSDIIAGGVLQADEVIAMGHVFRNVTARALRQDERWVLRLESPDIAGDLAWVSEGRGRLRARLSELALKPVKIDVPVTATAAAAQTTQSSLPALDVMAEKFSVQGLSLGRLNLQATNQTTSLGNEWLLDHFSVDSPDGKLVGDGLWRPYGNNRTTTLHLALDTPDVGRLLTRLSFVNAVRGGTASLKGTVSWRGTPASIDYPSLSGDIKVTAADGQFNKLDPGAGRLLGILSLQSLQRRMTLDFRDVFSEGFAFDSINGNTHIANGVMTTQDLEIRGPAARVFMTGSTDIVHETHNLHVAVQPTLSETVAIGAAVVGAINPLIGLATYVAQKVLRDPVEKIFAFQYGITGSWADPKIDKLNNQGKAQSEPQVQAR